jgi:hypothetical protein
MEELGTILTKVCSVCNEDKDYSHFSKDKYQKSGYNSSCKVCENIRKAESYEGRKWEVFNYKGCSCEICGAIENAEFYDFHHRVPEDKSFDVTSNLMRKWSTLLPELDKCLMLCPNCHRKEHIRIRNDKAKDKTAK